jgi:hypothetical protein
MKNQTRYLILNMTGVALFAAAFFVSVSLTLASSHLPFAVGDAVNVTGAICIKEGHIELLDAHSEDVNEGKETERWRHEDEWDAQVRAGNCRWLDTSVLILVAEINGPFKTFDGPAYSIRYEGEPAVFVIWFYELPTIRQGGGAI